MSKSRRPSEDLAGGALRVIVLGEGGLDASVREDVLIETVRPRTALEAVGEVASPPASAKGRRTVVLVGPSGEPEGEREVFVSALRRADPGAKVVRVGVNGAGSSHLYDAVLRAPATSEALRGVVASSVGEAARAQADGLIEIAPLDLPAERPVPLPRAVEVRLDEAIEAPASDAVVDASPEVYADVFGASSPGSRRDGADGASAAMPGDAALLAALSEPRPAFERLAVDLIRQRTGLAGASFVPEGREAVPGGVEVMAGARTIGRLVVAEASGPRGSNTPVARPDLGALRPHAAWLGAWLDAFERHRSLRRAAFTDPLTGAWNRRYFEGFLDAALDRARAARRTVTVLVFDIDEFKTYNDRYGHPAGDEILVETVRALKASVRPSDRVCRIGGDEFAVVFDEPEGPRQSGSRPPESVYVLAKRVQRKIGEKEFPKLGADARGTLTISGGLAAFPWDGHDAETLLARADELACQSKRQGKNAITVGPGAERVCRGAGGGE